MRTLRTITTVILLLFSFSIPSLAHAADLDTALFGDGGVFEHEGGFQNLRNDGGNWTSGKVGQGKMCGGTKYGISCAYHPGVDIKNLTRAGAAKLYRVDEWRTILGDEIASQRIATKLMNLAVNCGSPTALRLVRKTIADLGGPGVGMAGKNGLTPEEVAWINQYTRSDYLSDGTADKARRKLFWRTLVLYGMDYYLRISKNPVKRQWLYTWGVRVVAE